jgi:heme-degrading monooxygenase HmoA
MPYLLERHKVRDYDRWRGVFDADSAGREAAGCRGARIFRNAEDPQEVVVLFEWDSLESARRRIESATLSRKFEEAGVSGGVEQTEFYLLEEEAQPKTT